MQTKTGAFREAKRGNPHKLTLARNAQGWEETLFNSRPVFVSLEDCQFA